MSALVECPHFGRPLDFPTECTICSGADKKLADEQKKAGRTFHTRFHGFCRVCASDIHVGDLIFWTEGDSAMHAECADEAENEADLLQWWRSQQ